MHRQAERFKFPRFRILPAWYRNRDQYTCARLIHSKASGEKGIRPDLIFLQCFSANLMYVPSSLSSWFNLLSNDLLDRLLECAFPTRSINLCLIIFSSSSQEYVAATRGNLVFNRRKAGRTTFGGADPMISAAIRSMTNN